MDPDPKNPNLTRQIPLMTGSHTAIPHDIEVGDTKTKSPTPINEKINFVNNFAITNRNNLEPLSKKPSPPSQEISTNKSFYSNRVIAPSRYKNENMSNKKIKDAVMQPSNMWIANTEGNIPKLYPSSIKVPPLVEKAKLSAIGKTTKNLEISDFDGQSYKPKVQIQHVVPPGNKPRRVQIERDRRDFEISVPKDLERILEDRNVNYRDLLCPDAYNKLFQPKVDVFRNNYTFKRYLGLELFDNNEFDNNDPFEHNAIEIITLEKCFILRLMAEEQ